ncbi:MAG: hypoxanthine phosphoribosyltransferase [Actinomycetia bacterium]|nr:hypoxanthine phosphoribosyltransferase [Actinomycetes bacterium]
MTVAPPATLLTPDAIAEHVERLAREIATAHPEGVVLVSVMKGALLFTADLVRAFPRDVPVEVDFMAISRYAPQRGRVRILKDLEADVAQRAVVVVEDIVDTGLTVAFLQAQMRARDAASVEVCALLDRPVRRIVPLEVQYVGREIDDIFVLGYGLHHQDLYRNVPGVYIADRATVLASPEAYLPHLYPGAFAGADDHTVAGGAGGDDVAEPGGRVNSTRNGGGQ